MKKLLLEFLHADSRIVDCFLLFMVCVVTIAMLIVN